MNFLLTPWRLPLKNGGLEGKIMNFLLTPWRLPYLLNHKKSENCIFCEIIKEGVCETNLSLLKNDHIMIVLNRYPYNNGHMMIVPLKHCATLLELDKGALHALSDALFDCERILREVYNPHGINIGMNIGEAGGAGIAEHLHFHIVPRWKGDTNFISIIGETRLLPEDLHTTYHRLKKFF